jgi:hypothetical protein
MNVPVFDKLFDVNPEAAIWVSDKFVEKMQKSTDDETKRINVLLEAFRL